MKTININKIEKVDYDGEVYNLELNSKSNKDDLFWIEQETGIVSHNCFPKDLNALRHLENELGLHSSILDAAWIKNLEVREKRDWEDIKGAVSK